jgi:hypothetical protein
MKNICCAGKRLELESVEPKEDLERRMCDKKCSSPVEVEMMDFDRGSRRGEDVESLLWRNATESQRSYSVWPGFLHWYDWAPSAIYSQSPLYQEQQDSPLDLSIAVKLSH